MDKVIYLDNNATTQVAPEVRAALEPLLTRPLGNPAALHQLGVDAHTLLQEARTIVAAAVGLPASGLVFTSGGSEANALALLGVARRRRRPGHLLVSAIEHPSVLETCRALGEEGWALTELPVDAHGLVDPAAVAAQLRPETVLVSIAHGNHIVGTLQPLRDIVRAVRRQRADVLIHTDGVQSFLKEPLDLRAVGVDLVSLSAHKVHGLPGSGALVCGPGVTLRPLWRGGLQEAGRRAGTPNLLGAVAFGVAVTRGLATRASDVPRLRQLRDRLQTLLQEAIPGLRVNGHPTARLPGHLHVSLPGVSSEPLLHALEARQVIASAGSACHAAARALEPVLVQLGYRDSERWGHLRLTLSRETTAEEVDHAAAAIVAAQLEVARAHR